jgi:uncharacterized surface protein with fasciclin (FAS1) repeats
MKMLAFIRPTFLYVAAGLIAVNTLTSCKKDDETTATPQTITDIVNSNSNFTLLKKAVTKAGLATALTGPNLTVFAPDDAAFTASGITSTVIDGLSAAELADILTYHVIGAKVPAASVPASDTVNTLQGENIYASKNANGVFVNGVRVKTADVSASNGVIHIISKVLTPPTETIAEIASGNSNLSLLVTAVVHGGLLSAVSGPGKYTVFAPTNAAFTAAGFPTDASITGADAAVVGGIVKGHVLPSNVFASDLINGNTAATLQAGINLLIGTTPPSVKVNGSTNGVSNITTADIIATNGVIHVIDKVILP